MFVNFQVLNVLNIFKTSQFSGCDMGLLVAARHTEFPSVHLLAAILGITGAIETSQSEEMRQGNVYTVYSSRIGEVSCLAMFVR